MDSTDLLERENEFKKLNKQLEKKTEILMKEIEKAMGKQDFFSELPHNISLYQHPHYKKHRCDSSTPSHSPSSTTPKTTPKTTPTKIRSKSPAKSALKPVANRALLEPQAYCRQHCCQFVSVTNNDTIERTDVNNFLHAFVTVQIQNKVLPTSFMEGATVESVCKFLASKTKLLQEQVEMLQNTVDKKVTQCEKHLARLADLESERLTFLNNINSLKAEASSTHAKCAAIQNRLTEKERAYEKERSELDSVRSRLKQVTSKMEKNESKCCSYEMTIDKLRKDLEAAKIAEKEFRTASRDHSSSHQIAISRLEKRVRALNSRIHKQSELIHNLKKQNALLTTEAAAKAIEKEYNNFLNKDF